MDSLTRDNISRIHRIVVLDEAKAVHELDLGNVASTMGLEVVLDIFFRDCSRRIQGQRSS